MKPIHIAALVGGAAAFYYFTRGGTAQAASKPRAPRTGAFTLRTDPSGGKGCVDASGKPVPLSFCTQLEGYFSTGACCSNCAHGLRCSGN